MKKVSKMTHRVTVKWPHQSGDGRLATRVYGTYAAALAFVLTLRRAGTRPILLTVNGHTERVDAEAQP